MNQLEKMKTDGRVVVGNNTRTYGVEPFYEHTGNLYYSVAVISERARQLSDDLKAELNEKLAEFGTAGESLEEIVENREQIEIAKHYEKQPKPALKSIEEYLNDEIYFSLNGPHGDLG